jgi:hypothetical protein
VVGDHATKLPLGLGDLSSPRVTFHPGERIPARNERGQSATK